MGSSPVDYADGVRCDRPVCVLPLELDRKREIMLAWSTWLEKRVQEAIAAGPRPLDVEALKAAIYRARCEERLLRMKLRTGKFARAAE